MIVQNALRLFSQDRTGLADYALESGGQKLCLCSAQTHDMTVFCNSDYIVYFVALMNVVYFV